VRRVLTTAFILMILGVVLASFSIEGGPVLHLTSYEAHYEAEPWIAPGLGLTGLYEVVNKVNVGITGEISLVALNNKAGLGLLEVRYEAFRMGAAGLHVGICLGLLADTVPGGKGLIGDWVPHLHIAFGPKLVGFGAITDSLDFSVSVSALFVGLFLSEYPADLPLIDYLSIGASVAYRF